MAQSLDKISYERRHMREVSALFEGALEHFKQNLGDPSEFYLACADYLIPSQQRLFAQDKRLGQVLKSRVDENDNENLARIDALERSLSISEEALRKFEIETETFRKAGHKGRRVFEEESQAYKDVMKNVLATQRHALIDLTSKFLKEEDWAYIADFGDDVLAHEKPRYERVTKARPEAIPFPSFPDGPPDPKTTA